MGSRTKTAKDYDEVSDAMAWVAYYRHRRPADYARAVKGRTPSDEFIALGDKEILIQRANGNYYLTLFPFSLSVSKGQKLLHDAAKRLDYLTRHIPHQCIAKLQEFESLPIKRQDTKNNLRMLATAILHRAAIEGKTEVLFAYDSLSLHVEKSFGKKFRHRELKQMLTKLNELKYFTVTLGEQGYHALATKIETNLPGLPSTPLHTYLVVGQGQVDEFLDQYAHAMDKVYVLESTKSVDRAVAWIEWASTRKDSPNALSLK